MMEQVIDIFLWFLAGYALLGVFFSIFFALKGASLIDEGVKNAPWHFKFIIIPGSIMLWIFLLLKIVKRND